MTTGPDGPFFSDQVPKDPARCTAKAKGSGEQCKRPPRPGATVCHKHGAAEGTPAAAKADQRLAERTTKTLAMAAVAEWDPDLVPADAAEVLLRVMHVTFMQARAHHAQLAAKETQGGSPYVRFDTNGREFPSALALLEQTERKMAADMATKAVGADLAGRHLRLMERYADSFEQFALGLAKAFGQDPELPATRAVIFEQLQVLESGAA
jgi:hypothetical protein